MLAAIHGRPRYPHHAARRTRKDGVTAPESVLANQRPGRGHEIERRAADRFAKAARVGADGRGEVGVGDRGLGPSDESRQGRDLAAEADEADAGDHGDFPGPALVQGVEIAVQKGDRGALETRRGGSAQVGRQCIFIETDDHRAVRGQPLAGLDDAGVEGRRLDDIQGEELGASLVADQKRVGKPGGGDEEGLGAGALEKGVGRHRGPDADGPHRPGREGSIRRHAHEATHALDRRIAPGGGLRQQLESSSLAARRDGDDVGECASAIDGEGPQAPLAGA